MARISEFRELRVYRTAYEAGMRVFWLSGDFPDEERFGLSAQIRRSSRSVAANIAEAWRRRRYPGSFVAKLVDADAEAAETRAHLDFALGCRYLARPTYDELDTAYAKLSRQLVRMITQAPSWAPGRASGRPAGLARAHPQSPSPREEGKGKEEVRLREGSANPPALPEKKSANERAPRKKARP